jgi:large subunit ribosomal protein L9
MQLLLLKDVKGVGKRYEVKSLADGYGRFLLSQKSAVLATAANIKLVQKQQTTHAAVDAALLKAISGVTIELKAKANPQGHLFAAIHEREIIQALKGQAKINIERQEIIKLVKPLKEVGEHEVPVHGVSGEAKFKVVIKPL